MKQVTFEQDGLVITASASTSHALITWRGVSDARNPQAFLDPVTKSIVEHVKGVDVTVDFTALEYMNSATVSSLLGLVRLLDANGKHVVIVFSDEDWQRTHLMCMTAIARTLHNVSVQRRSAV